MMQNRSLIYKQYPTGLPVPGEHLEVEDRPIDLSAPPLGGLVVEVLYASYDPYLRGKMRDPSIKYYSSAFEIGQAINNFSVARVLKSDSEDFQEDDLFTAQFLPIAEYATVEASQLAQIERISNPHDFDLGVFLGPLGMPGLTAYSGLQGIGRPKKGETIFVSSAAGAVGQMVGQLAKLQGLTVIGSVGSDDKVDFITKELGFDSGFNYKKEDVFQALPRLAPDGIDIYFDNVGAEHLEAALISLKTDGRVIACGSIAGYNKAPEDRPAIRGMWMVVGKRLTIQGLYVFAPQFGPAYRDDFQEKVQKWIADGSLKFKLDVTEGIDNAAEGFVGMLKGDNFGKAILKVK